MQVNTFTEIMYSNFSEKFAFMAQLAHDMFCPVYIVLLHINYY